MRTTSQPGGDPSNLLEVVLRNPYDQDVKRRRRVLEVEGHLPNDDATWRQWWSALPVHLRSDEAAAIAFLAGIGTAVGPSRSSAAVLDAVQALPPALRDPCAEIAVRSLAVWSSLEALIGDSEVMGEVRKTCWAAAFGESLETANGLTKVFASTPVLIEGETGTGKELVAQALFKSMKGKWTKTGWHPSKNDAVHLASITPELVQSLLFGHEKGAFTTAEKERTGVLERCHNGVVFLDEIAELPPSTQVALLRTLQEGKARRIGADSDHDAAPRIISATHQDLEELVARNVFRQDLFYRLSSVVITLPPLRDRLSDIPLLVEKEVQRLVAPESRAHLRDKFTKFVKHHPSYEWFGNVRELYAVVRTLAHGLTPRLRKARLSEVRRIEVPTGLAEAKWSMREMQQWYVRRVLHREKTQVRAAEVLSVDPSTLRRYLTGEDHDN